MTPTMFYLSTCSTCTRIIKEIEPDKAFRMQDIKSEPITESQLDEMARMAGNYEALFSRRAMKFRSMGLNKKDLTEDDYRRLILQEYTFLKRPVFVFENEIFIGNSKSTIEAVKSRISR